MKLYPHQEQVLQLGKDRNKVAHYLDMGLGKTFTGSEKLFELGNRLNLVICQKSKIGDWCEHFETHYSDRGIMVIDFTKNQDLKAEDIILMTAHTIVIVVINYELAWRRPELSRLGEITLLLDESSLIQNATAKQTKFIMRLDATNVVLLSGTPCGGKFENLWTQSRLLGWNITQDEFNRRYVNWDIIKIGNMYHKVVSKRNPYKNVDELKANLRLHGAAFMKTEECFELPKQRFFTVKTQPSNHYKKFKKTRVIEVEGNQFVGNTPLNYRLGLRMLASRYSQAKLDAFSDMLESTNERLVVFYSFVTERNALVELCERAGKPISRIDGDVKDLSAYENEDNSVTLCQYQAGSMGLNLQRSHIVVYFSLPERSELFEQSKKRIHRIGQGESCLYYIMMSANSIDEYIFKALQQKKDYTDELFREQFGE